MNKSGKLIYNLKEFCIRLFIVVIIFFSSVDVNAQYITQTFSPNADAYTSSLNASTNFGSDDYLKVYRDTSSITDTNRAYVQFDLTSVPPGAVIYKAELKFYADSVVDSLDYSFYLDRIDGTWNDGSINWNSQPTSGDFDKIQVSSTSINEGMQFSIDVIDHVEQMTNYSNLNNGWSLKLQNESGGNDFGIVLGSADNPDVNKRPVLEIGYVLPFDVNLDVTHCNPGQNDGAIDATLTGGGVPYKFNIYKVIPDTNSEGNASASGVYSSPSGHLDNNVIDYSGLEPGVYMINMLDSLYFEMPVNGHDKWKFEYQKYFFVGRKGEITTGMFLPHDRYNISMFIKKNRRDSIESITNWANTNFLDDGEQHYLGVSSSRYPPQTEEELQYETASLIRYNADFDQEIIFHSVELRLRGWTKFYRKLNQSSNATHYTLVTSPWDEDRVTWNTRPSVNPIVQLSLPATPSQGYHDDKWDTLEIKPFFNYWQQNPNQNYGFELALQNYAEAARASRDYSGPYPNKHYVKIEFEIPADPLNADISIDEDDIVVNPQDGYPPYTYLWSNGSTNKDQLNIPDGIYWVKIWDSKGNMQKYEVSKEQSVVWEDVNCSEVTEDVLHLSVTCANSNETGTDVGVAISSSAQGQVVTEYQHGWGEVQFGEFNNTKAFGFSVEGQNSNSLDNIGYGFKIYGDGSYEIVKNYTAFPQSGSNLYKNDIIKVEKSQQAITYLINGAEVDYFQFSQSPIPSLVLSGAIFEDAQIEGANFGFSEKQFNNEPCQIQLEASNDIIDPVSYCPEDNIQLTANGPAYIRWFPSTGLSCDDCSSPILQTGANGNYLVRGYSTYSDFIYDENHCAQESIEIVMSEGCTNGECSYQLEYLPEQTHYCAGDVIQFNLIGDGLDYIQWSPSSELNCTDCLDPQFTFAGGSSQITLNIYHDEAMTELCATESISIIESKSCNENEGLTFNNYGAVVWVEDNELTANDMAFIGMYCNYLNEKVLLNGPTNPATNGVIINEGRIKVKKNWTNNAENSVFEGPVGTYTNLGDTYQDGSVGLFGGYQKIKGVQTTGFYYLDLTGTAKKEMFIDTDVKVELDLTNIEMATRNNILHVINTDNNAVTNTPDLGFVSSDNEGGYMLWDMDPTNGIYFVPLGSSLGGIRYKPIEITAAQQTSVLTRLVNYNPLYNGLDAFAPDVASICGEYFYYVLPDNQVDIASMRFHYNTIDDGSFQHIAHWDNDWATANLGFPRWEKTSNISIDVPTGTVVNNERITTSGWSYFTDKEFVLAKAGFVVDTDNFGDSGDDNNDDDVNVEIVPQGSSSGGGVNTTSPAGSGNGGNTYTPTPVEGIYNLEVDQFCGVDGTIQFEIDASGNVVDGSVIYIIGSNTYPLAEDLYATLPTGNSGNGIFQLFSIPESDYQCNNNIDVLLTDGMVLESTGLLQVQVPSGITVNNIQIFDLSNTLIDNTNSSSWTPTPGLSEGVYKVEIEVTDGAVNSVIKGIFILKVI